MANVKKTSKYNSVLLIDDNELDNFINQKIIESVNFSETIFVNTGSVSALEFLKNINLIRSNASAVFPEIIFVDINMPIMDGFQFIQNLISTQSKEILNTKIVVLTTSLNPADKAKAEGISKEIRFLNKPLTAAALETI
jgi:CheY-like chemotaxis protein